MTYGAKAVISLENGFLKMRTSTFTSDGNDELPLSDWEFAGQEER